MIIFVLLSFTNLYSQTKQDKELNLYYNTNQFFNKKVSEITDLVLIGDFNNTKIYNRKIDNNYFGNIKLREKTKYFFYKGILSEIIYYPEIQDLKNNINYISKLLYEPTGYIEKYPNLTVKETQIKYLWKGFFMIVEVSESEISFIDRKVEAQIEIDDTEYWKLKGY